MGPEEARADEARVAGRGRTLGIWRWSATVVCLVIALVALSTLRYVYVWGVDWLNSFVVIVDGTVSVSWPVERFKTPAGVEVTASEFVEIMTGIERPTPGSLRDWPLLPMAGTNGQVRCVYVPLWIPFVVIGACVLLLWRRARRTPPRCCQRCGYELTGNVSGRCPECRAAIDTPKREPDGSR